MVVRGTNKQDKSKEERCDSSSGSKEIKEASKRDVSPTKEGKRRVQECISASTCPGGEISTDYYEALAWMWDTQNVVCPPHKR